MTGSSGTQILALKKSSDNMQFQEWMNVNCSKNVCLSLSNTSILLKSTFHLLIVIRVRQFSVTLAKINIF